MNNENIVPVTYNGKVVGWVDSNKTPIYISPIDDKSQKLLEELMSSSIYISSRQTG
jgi:putative methionine-R-sulfoxide reductase with GAF domain